MHSRAVYASAAILVACAIAGCSGNGGGSGGTSLLTTALSHVADTSGTRAQIMYDDTSDLVRLSGTGLGSAKGFAALRGAGASSVVPYTSVLTGDTGISLYKEDYAISAGLPPKSFTFLHGGQSGSLVTSRMTKLGWKKNGGKLVGPPALGGSGSQEKAVYSLEMHEVQASGSDVTFGESGANLSQIGSPSGTTLASDPLISALANCLGNVVAAEIGTGSNSGGRNPVEVAVGVRWPASNSATPHAVACVAWSSQAKAEQFTTDAKKALTTGLSLATNEPYSKLMPHPSVADLSGSQHIVRWQADTPGAAVLVFQEYERLDLPGLPDCGRLTGAARARVVGCG